MSSWPRVIPCLWLLLLATPQQAFGAPPANDAGHAAGPIPTLGALPLQPHPHPQSYRFLVIGHAYGSPETSGVHPAASLLANLDRLRNTGAEFVVMLGDVYRSPTEPHIAALQRALQRLGLPVINAVGNHDVEGGFDYVARFGPTHFTFLHRGDRFVVLDTATADGKLDREQQTWLQALLAEQASGNLFLFSHHLLWREDRPELMAARPNVMPRRPSGYAGALQASVHAAALRREVHWLSGDVGTDQTLALFYDRVPDRALTFVATGLGDTAHDAVVLVEVDDGHARLNALSLSGKTLLPLAQHGTAHWRSALETKPRTLAVRVGEVLRDHRFWLGFGLACLLCGGLLGARLLLRRARTQWAGR